MLSIPQLYSDIFSNLIDLSMADDMTRLSFYHSNG
jgi:hypothetical protein